MRVAHVVKSFSKLSETFIYDSLVELQQQGIENYVFTFNRVYEQDRPFPNVYVVSEVKKTHPYRLISRFGVALGLRHLNSHYTFVKTAHLKVLLKNLAPDIVHGHFGYMGYLVLPVAEHLQIPLVTSFHGDDAFMLSEQAIWRQRYLKLFEYASKIIPVSVYMQERLISLGVSPEKLQVIHVGKKTSDYPFLQRTLPLRRWVSVGRLVEKKGFDDCLRAFSLLKDEDFELRIVGDGPMLAELKILAFQLGIARKIEFLGALPHSVVQKLYQESDAFILCSKTAHTGDKEGIPTVLMEAQAYGLPCVSTFHSGIPEVIPDENHFLLAQEGNIEHIAECIRQVFNAEPQIIRDIAMRGRTKVNSEFNIESETSKLISLYDAVLARKQS